MNVNNSEQLKAAAEAGNIDLLYAVIQDDPYILELIDSIPFVDTPLHIAASMGHLQFATEIMMLKPSYALKLNQQGYSPIHLAMQNGHKTMVTRFVNINKELVSVQGRDGVTPLHFAIEIDEVDLFANFILLCPESIKHLTVKRETALHIAVKNERYEILQILVGWLNTNEQTGAKELEKKILNQEDEEGNTILHISVLSTYLPVIISLLIFFGFRQKFNLVRRSVLSSSSGFRLLPIAINYYILFEEHVNEIKTYIIDR
jgi:ankyrin repeat protein